MTELELIFDREDLFAEEPRKKIVIAEFEDPPVKGDYLMIASNMSLNKWAREYDEEFMEAVKGETYVITGRIYTGEVILYNLQRFDDANSIGGFFRNANLL